MHLQIVDHNKPVECVDDEGHQLGDLGLHDKVLIEKTFLNIYLEGEGFNIVISHGQENF